MSYRPAPDLPDELRREFQRVADELLNLKAEAVFLAQRNAAPAKYTDGMVVYADGSNWDPDAAATANTEGIWAYYNGQWNFLG